MYGCLFIVKYDTKQQKSNLEQSTSTATGIRRSTRNNREQQKKPQTTIYNITNSNNANNIPYIFFFLQNRTKKLKENEKNCAQCRISKTSLLVGFAGWTNSLHVWLTDSQSNQTPTKLTVSKIYLQKTKNQTTTNAKYVCMYVQMCLIVGTGMWMEQRGVGLFN